MFQFPGFALNPMYSGLNTSHVTPCSPNPRPPAKASVNSEYKRSKVGFPIRKSSDQSLFAAPQGLSQRTTSFIASQRQGIHRMLLRHLIALMIDVRHLGRSDRRSERPVFGSLRRRLLVNTPGPTACGAVAGLLGLKTPNRPNVLPLHDFKHPRTLLRAARESSMTPNVAWNLVEPDGIEPTTSSLQS